MNAELTRRTLFKYLGVICASAIDLIGAHTTEGLASQAPTLKAMAKRSGKLVAMFSGQHDLKTDPIAARTIATEFDML
jgi:hypothetical protein